MSIDNPETAIVQAAAVLGVMLLAWWLLGVARWIIVLRPVSVATRQLVPTIAPSQLPGTRRLAVALITLSLPLLQACTSNPEPDAPVLVWVEDDPTATTPTTTPATTLTTATPTSALATTGQPVVSPSTAAPPASATDATVDTPPAAEPAEFDADSTLPSTGQDRDSQDLATTYEVQPGDSLWTIASTHVVGVGEAPPTSSDVASYWRELLHRNRSSIASGNPDLIFPGELLELPT